MTTIEYNGKKYELLSTGFLAKVPKKLDPNWVEYVCKEVGIPIISPEHPDWVYIENVHKYLLKNNGQITELGAQKASGLDRKMIFDKFGKLMSGLCRMAGATECFCRGCGNKTQIWSIHN